MIENKGFIAIDGSGITSSDIVNIINAEKYKDYSIVLFLNTVKSRFKVPNHNNLEVVYVEENGSLSQQLVAEVSIKVTKDSFDDILIFSKNNDYNGLVKILKYYGHRVKVYCTDNM